ncbi:MAG TPA: LptA/OstA family protein [Xanthobacteraceae bacterium]|jgi:lipopolysaccharide export system protein LptA|nr:LptA/OstA family protein [Xanthobacteraceae bacterium]
MSTRAMPARMLMRLVVAAGLAALAFSSAAAQSQKAPPNALQGFSQNRDKPVKIESATLEVRDKDKVATFAGNVHLVQGDTTLRCKTLVVYYEQNGGSGGIKTEQPGPGGQQQIRRLEAKGGVLVTQKDQTATGDNGVFDMKANTVTLIGNVVVTQGTSVLSGDRLIVNLTTGVSNVECNGNSSKCKVRALIQPGSSSPLGHSENGSAKEASKPRLLRP